MQMNSSYLILTVIFVLLWLENISDHLFSYQKHFLSRIMQKEKRKNDRLPAGFEPATLSARVERLTTTPRPNFFTLNYGQLGGTKLK